MKGYIRLSKDKPNYESNFKKTLEKLTKQEKRKKITNLNFTETDTQILFEYEVVKAI